MAQCKKVTDLVPGDHVLGYGEVEKVSRDFRPTHDLAVRAVLFKNGSLTVWGADESLYVRHSGDFKNKAGGGAMLRVEQSAWSKDWVYLRIDGSVDGDGIHVSHEELRDLLSRELPESR